MTDLQQQIETYLQTTSIPVDVDDLVSDLEFGSLADASPNRVSLRRRPVFVFAFAAALAVFLIGVPLIMLGGFSSAPVPRDPVTIPVGPESVTSVTDTVRTTTRNTEEKAVFVPELNAGMPASKAQIPSVRKRQKPINPVVVKRVVRDIHVAYRQFFDNFLSAV